MSAFFLALGACTVVLSLGGCAREVGPPSAKELDLQFPTAAPTRSQGSASADLDVYIDDSKSMAGFVGTAHSNYRQVLEGLLLSAGTAQLRASVYPISSDHRAISTLPLSVVQSASFYGKSDTPLAALLRTVAARREHTSILVSDMVQSERGVDKQGLLAALAEVAGNQPEMRLLAFRSEFQGAYYPEAHSGGKAVIPVAVGQGSRYQGRPFYLLVIAPDRASMTKVSDYLLSRLSVSESFDPAQTPFEITDVALSKDAKDSKGKTGWEKASDFRARGAGQNRFESTFALTAAEQDKAPVELPLILTLKAGIPLRCGENMDLSGDSVEWTGKFQKLPYDTVPIERGTCTSVEKKADGNETRKIRAVLVVHTPPAHAWDVYHLNVRPGEGNLDVPEWVHQWSTDDDSSPIVANKTFQLEIFVRTLANTISEHELCGEWLLKVGRGR